jgi:hypothetical protein
MTATTNDSITDEQILDRIFAKAGLRLSAKALVEGRLDEMQAFPSRITREHGPSVHLHQRITETVENALGTEEVGWTVVDCTDGTITMRNQPSWDREKTIEPSALCGDTYEVETTKNGNPRFAY